MTRKYSMLLAPILILLLSSSSNAFSILTTPTQRFSSNALKVGSNKGLISSSPTTYLSLNGGRRNPVRRSFNEINNGSESQIRLSMYNLPPSGGGGGKDDIANIAKGAFSIALIVGFFISPLGGLVLGLLNSFLVLIFVLPLVATVGFQVWQKVNTISGVCPNCDAPATVLKQKRSNSNDVDTAIPQQSICFNCGAVLQSNSENTEINNVSGRTNIDDLSSEGAGGTSLFDILSGMGGDRSGGGGSGGIGGDTTASKSRATTVETSKSTATTVETTSTRASSSSGPARKISKPMDIIDADIEEEDKPFQ